MKKTYLSLAVMLAVSFLASSALAKSVTTPFGAAAVEARVGSATINGVLNQYVIWKRKSDNLCSAVVVFNGAVFTEQLIVNGGGGDDTMIVQGFFPENIVCGQQVIALGAPGANFQFLTLRGGNGNDALFGGVPATHLQGQAGNDIIIGGGGGAFPIESQGGSSGDSVEMYGLAGDERLIGQDGNDCLWDESSFASVFDCGAFLFDNDSFRAPFFPPPAGCNTPVSCCAFGLFAGLCQ